MGFFVLSHSDTVQRVVVLFVCSFAVAQKSGYCVSGKNVLIVAIILAYLQIVPVSVVIVHWVNPVR